MSFHCLEQVDENKILFTSSNEIKLWDMSEEQILRIFNGHTNQVNSVCMLKHDLFASCSSDKTIKIWNLNNEECLKTLFYHKKCVLRLKLLSNGHLASCSRDKTIQIWNYESGQCLNKVIGLIKEICCIEE